MAMLLVIICVACSKYSKDPDLKLARDFIDAYYVFANQQQALNLTTGSARQAIQKEIELLKDVPQRQESYRSRDVLFELKKKLTQKDEVAYLFELTILIPKMADRKELINITIDRKLNKIKYFGTVTHLR